MKISRRSLLLATAASTAQPKLGSSAALQEASNGGAPLPGRHFRDEALREIAFPLGGIGTGTVSLSGLGGLRDWEIFNRPNKGSTLPFTFAALRIAGGGLAAPSVRVVERQPLPPFSGGFGSPRSTALGLPHFPDAVFTGSYPFAHVQLQDPSLPVEVSLEAFNPMVPLDTENSSLPVAVLTYRCVSRAAAPLEAALAFSAMNPVGYGGVGALTERKVPFFGGNLNEFKRQPGCQGVLMTSSKQQQDARHYGSMALATTDGDVSYRLTWEHGEWWDDFQKWWDEFLGKGRFGNQPAKHSDDGGTEFATLASHFSLGPG